MAFEIGILLLFGLAGCVASVTAFGSLYCIVLLPEFMLGLYCSIMGNKNLYKLLGKDNIQPLIETIYLIVKKYKNPNSSKILGNKYINAVVKALEKSYNKSNVFQKKRTILSFLRDYLLEKDEQKKISIKENTIKEMIEYAKEGHYLEGKIIGVKRIYLFIIILGIDIEINTIKNYFTIDFMKKKDSDELVHYSLSEFNELFELNLVNHLNNEELIKIENEIKEYIKAYIKRFFLPNF
jgi:hypothetical protein